MCIFQWEREQINKQMNKQAYSEREKKMNYLNTVIKNAREDGFFREDDQGRCRR